MVLCFVFTTPFCDYKSKSIRFKAFSAVKLHSAPVENRTNDHIVLSSKFELSKHTHKWGHPWISSSLEIEGECGEQRTVIL